MPFDKNQSYLVLFGLSCDWGIVIPFKQIKNKDGSFSTITNSIAFTVINNKNKKEGTFNANSKRLKLALKNVSKTLTGKLIQINHIVDNNDETNNTYTAKLLKESK